jgi:hypothetical protein
VDFPGKIDLERLHADVSICRVAYRPRRRSAIAIAKSRPSGLSGTCGAGVVQR